MATCGSKPKSMAKGGVVRLGGLYSVVAARFQSALSIAMFVSGGGNLLGVSPSTALAIGDVFEITVTYTI